VGISRSGIGVGASAAAAAVLLVAPAPAAASPLDGKHFTIDIFQGPVLGPSDVIGMAGAYAGYADGLAGLVANAASPALREPYNVSYFNWDVSPSLSIPLNLFGTRDDFANEGAAGHDYSDFLDVTLDGLVQYGPFGLGFSAELQRYSLASSEGNGVSSAVILGKFHALFAYRLLGDQLAFGGGVRIGSLNLTPGDQEAKLAIVGVAPEFGVLVRPDWQSFRVGATVRMPVHGGRLLGGDVTRSGGLALPDDVVLPWEIELGAAVQVGPRPLNPRWIDPHDEEAALHRSFMDRRHRRESDETAELARIGDPLERAARRQAIEAEEVEARAREEADEARILKGLEQERRARAWNWPREHLLLMAELLVTGAVQDGVSLQGFLGQNEADEIANGTVKVGSSGASTNFSPRLGVETEPIPDRMHTRAGTYYEPARLEDRSVGRQHFTFGADVRLFSTTWFGLVPRTTYKAQAYADLSPRYQSVSVGIGVWH
jgi:hypothetical protein